MSDRVLITITDGVADVVFNRADKRNALDNAMFSAIAEAGEHLKSESGVRAVVLSGDGASFCAGLDFSSFQAMAGGDNAEQAATRSDGNPGEMKDGRITHLGQQVCWVWQELAVPVIAAVHGHALGGGLQIALGFVLAFVYIIFYITSRTIAQAGSMDPLLACWLPNIVFSAIGIVLYKSVPR